MRVITLIVGLGILAGTVVYAEIAPPPPGPIGWETRITPGFDPPLEYYLVYGGYRYANNAKLDETIQGWGPKAGPALVSLYRNPEWADFRGPILNLIGKVDAPEISAFLKEEAETILTDSPPSGRPDYTKVSLLNMLARRDPATADEIAYRIVKDPAAPYFVSMIGYLTLRAGQDDGAPCRAKLEAIAAETNDAQLRQRIQNALSGQAAQIRAQESMHLVLEREAKGEKP